MTSIPAAWIDQTRTGGIVLAPVFSGLAKLTVTGQGHAEGRFIGPGYFTQSGPRRLWDDIETIHQTWRCLGAPPRERFGLTVTPQRQTIWLDTPDSDHQWQVG